MFPLAMRKRQLENWPNDFRQKAKSLGFREVNVIWLVQLRTITNWDFPISLVDAFLYFSIVFHCISLLKMKDFSNSTFICGRRDVFLAHEISFVEMSSVCLGKTVPLLSVALIGALAFASVWGSLEILGCFSRKQVMVMIRLMIIILRTRTVWESM